MPCSRPASHPSPQKRSAFCVARSPDRLPAPKSYCATVGFVSCALLTPYKQSFTTEKKAGSAFCVARSPDRLPAPKSYCASVGFFARALLTPCKPPLTTKKKPGNVFCVARSPDRLPAPKSYCATVGFVSCALLTPYKPSLTTEKKAGSALCAAKPLKKPLAAKSYYGAVGISLAGLACHSLCRYLQAPLLKQRPRRFLDEALGFGLLSRLVRMFRGSNPPPRGFLHFCFCLGSCRAFKGQSFQGSQQSTLKTLFPYS